MPPKIVPTPETPVEILSNCIAHISRSVRDMRAGRLTDKAIITLVHDDTGIPKRTINAVITSLEYLERTYLKEKNT